MRFGCCVAPDQIAALAAAGGDYCELTVAGTVMGGDEAAFARLRADAAAWPLPPRAYNVLLPGDLPVVGPVVDRARLDNYLRLAFGRVHDLSGDLAPIVVFGSGRSRSIPAGFDRAAALEQLAGFLDRSAVIAATSDVILALEPLRRAESNIFNTLGESAAFLRERGLTGVRLLADLYHIEEEGEPLSAIDDCADLIVHAHVADSGRRAPGLGSYPIAAFFQRLRANGYTGDCSIECRWEDFPAQIAPALAALRDARHEA